MGNGTTYALLAIGVLVIIAMIAITIYLTQAGSNTTSCKNTIPTGDNPCEESDYPFCSGESDSMYTCGTAEQACGGPAPGCSDGASSTCAYDGDTSMYAWTPCSGGGGSSSGGGSDITSILLNDKNLNKNTRRSHQVRDYMIYVYSGDGVLQSNACRKGSGTTNDFSVNIKRGQYLIIRARHTASTNLHKYKYVAYSYDALIKQVSDPTKSYLRLYMVHANQVGIKNSENDTPVDTSANAVIQKLMDDASLPGSGC